MINKKNIHLIGIYVFATYPLFNLKLQTLLMAFFGVTTITSFYLNGTFNTFRNDTKKIILFLMPFIGLLIGLIYTDNISEGLKVIERSLSFIAFPLIFILIPFQHTQKERNTIIYIFSISLILITAYSFVNIGLVGFRELYSGQANSYFKFRTDFETYSKLHPVYVNYMYGLASLFLLHLIRDKIAKKEDFLDIFLVLLVVLILTIFAFIIASRTALISLITCSFLLLLFTDALSKKIKTIILSVGATVLIGFYFFIPSLQERVNETASLFKKDTTKENGTSVRKEIFTCTKTLLTENFIVGLGTGDVDDALQVCYDKNNLKESSSKGFNTHNQYFDYWLKGGLFTLGALILLMFNIGIEIKEQKLVLIVLFISICFLTENILNRQVGIITTCFWLGLLFFNKKEHV